jgi:uncharacterized protein YcbX
MCHVHGRAMVSDPKFFKTAVCAAVVVTSLIGLFALQRRQRQARPINLTRVIKEVWVFPVKSCRGIQVREAELTETGIKYDREWVVLKDDGDHAAVTLRQAQKLALVFTTIDDAAGVLRLSHADKGTVEVPLAHAFRDSAIEYDVWGTKGHAIREGDDVARWLSDIVGQKVALFRATAVRDPTGAKAVVPPNSAVWAHDFSSLMIIGTATIDHIREVSGDASVASHRFRGNVVIETTQPFEECAFRTMNVGAVNLFFSKLCTRCTVTAVLDSGSYHRSFEPLKTLRRAFSATPADGSSSSAKPIAGINVFHTSMGVIRVGDVLRVSDCGLMPIFTAATPDPKSPV